MKNFLLHKKERVSYKMISFLWFVIIVSVLFSIGIGIIIKKEEEIISRSIEIKAQEIKIKRLQSELFKYKYKLSRLNKNSNIRKRNEQNNEIEEAVKFAMIHAHPDNGGDTQKFIKFRKLYEEIKNEV